MRTIIPYGILNGSRLQLVELAFEARDRGASSDEPGLEAVGECVAEGGTWQQAQFLQAIGCLVLYRVPGSVVERRLSVL